MVLRCDLLAIPRRRVVRFDQSGTRELLIVTSFQRNRRKRVYVEVQWRSEADRKLSLLHSGADGASWAGTLSAHCRLCGRCHPDGGLRTDANGIQKIQGPDDHR
jgi:hypothetical protein